MSKLFARLGVTAVLAACALSSPALADQPINERQNTIERRIETGFRIGRLTRAEYRRLKAESASIRALEARYRRSGGLDGFERRDLNRRLDRLSAQIRFERRDGDRRY